MTQTLEFIAIGDGLGIKLTPEMVEKLGGHAGGRVSVSMTPAGLVLRKDDNGLAKQMDVARRVMDRRQDLLRKLAE